MKNNTLSPEGLEAATVALRDHSVGYNDKDAEIAIRAFLESAKLDEAEVLWKEHIEKFDTSISHYEVRAIYRAAIQQLIKMTGEK
jgi:hypothetical protein